MRFTPSSDHEDVDEFDVETSISESARRRQTAEATRREEAAAAEIENIRVRRPTPGTRVNPLDTHRPRRESVSPLAEAFRAQIGGEPGPIEPAPRNVARPLRPSDRPRR
jgi:hypothetical protein